MAKSNPNKINQYTQPDPRQSLFLSYYIAPTQVQARKIVWEALKGRLAGIAKFNEQTLEARVPNEDGESTTIYVGGWENRENYRGLTDVVHITFDETDSLKDLY